ncbi:hypothetical protein F5Y16DRAFT_106025 [Xylariaceae sp. FL0255]|nr:hypothetical protein F5Y16DRAFT_106025 [Xylariaceae sp. FL0255]
MSKLFTTATLVAAVQALAFDGKPAQQTQGVLPDATFAAPAVTAGPSVKELLKRQSDLGTLFVAPDATCGYVSGRAGAAYTCNDEYTCNLLEEPASSTGYVACCNGEVCGARVTCLDYTQVYSSSLCDDGCMQDTFTAKCTNEAQPYCGTVTFFAGIGDYYCDSLSISTAQQLYTTYNGENGVSWSTNVFNLDQTSSASSFDFSSFSFTDTSSTDTASSSSSSSTATNPTSSGGGDNGSSGNGGNNTSGDGGDNGNNGSSKKSSTPIGAIVGGVVGGVAVIVIAALGIFFLVRYKKNKKEATAPPTQPMQQNNMGPAGNGPAPGQGGAFPPQQPTYAQQPYQHTPSPQQSYYNDQKPAGFVGLAPVPDRNQSASPMSTHSNPHSPVSSMHSSWAPQTPAQQYNNMQPAHNVPPTVYEAGGNAIGGPTDLNSNHHGQFHEME